MEDLYRSQFRLPYSLYEQLKASAETHHRSINAELVARLEASFGSDQQIDLIAERLAKRLVELDYKHKE
ncbi:Arc-like DNA binding dprotein [Azomonas agilis]|uniref:Arc-like DNA binding dprotein n=1 Tax=Azomonas agilis TaxID=116849 RepID=A0A562HYG0_9GAMM|nr:Arc family DNA-binding protein [Azomonas agilis]TWH63817.1 Arc-like DNA binding dprotein [Azomonas agilis]